MFWVACSQPINLFIINYFVYIEIEHLKMSCGFISKYFDTYNFAMVCRYTTVKLLLKSPAGHCINVQNIIFCLFITWVGIFLLPIANHVFMDFSFALFCSTTMSCCSYLIVYKSIHANFSSLCFLTSKQVVKSLGATCS